LSDLAKGKADHLISQVHIHHQNELQTSSSENPSQSVIFSIPSHYLGFPLSSESEIKAEGAFQHFCPKVTATAREPLEHL
jgi:hypothetical protein